MPEKADETKKGSSTPKVKVGEIIQVKSSGMEGKRGKVVVLRENSVIVEIGKNPNTGEPIKTVVNHRNYKKVK